MSDKGSVVGRGRGGRGQSAVSRSSCGGGRVSVMPSQGRSGRMASSTLRCSDSKAQGGRIGGRGFANQEGFQVMLVLPPGVRDKVGQLINVTFHQSTRQVEVEAKEDAPQQPDIIVKFDLLLRRKMAVQIMRWLPRL